jgi:hypothetical protein
MSAGASDIAHSEARERSFALPSITATVPDRGPRTIGINIPPCTRPLSPGLWAGCAAADSAQQSAWEIADQTKAMSASVALRYAVGPQYLVISRAAVRASSSGGFQVRHRALAAITAAIFILPILYQATTRADGSNTADAAAIAPLPLAASAASSPSTTSSLSWHAAISHGAGPLGSATTSGADRSGDQFVFWRGTDGSLWDDWYTGATWHGPARISVAGRDLVSQPAVAVLPDGQQDVFLKGINGRLWEVTHTTHWTSRVDLGGFSWLGADRRSRLGRRRLRVLARD